jgi:hypothetical protein
MLNSFLLYILKGGQQAAYMAVRRLAKHGDETSRHLHISIPVLSSDAHSLRTWIDTGEVVESAQQSACKHPVRYRMICSSCLQSIHC